MRVGSAAGENVEHVPVCTRTLVIDYSFIAPWFGLVSYFFRGDTH